MEGYNSLAGVMGMSPELNIFRGFKALSVRNLLMLQGQLTLAEATLQRAILLDRQACQGTDKSTQWFQHEVKELLQAHDPDDRSDQWELTLNVRRLLKEYRRCFVPFTAGSIADQLMIDRQGPLLPFMGDQSLQAKLV